MTSHSVLDRSRTLIASLVAFLLVVAGAITATPAMAADGATVNGTVASATTSGITVNVSATGLGEATGAYAALIVKGTEAGLTGGGGYAAFAIPFPTIAAGASAFSLAAETADLDRDEVYEVLIWKQHSNPTPENIYGRGDVAVSGAQWDAVFGAVAPESQPSETASPEPTTSASPQPTTSPSPEPTTSASPEPTTSPSPQPTQTTAPAPVFEPELEVFAADGTTPIGTTALKAGDKVVVKGSGYDPAANVGGRGVPIPATLPQGTYVVFGSFGAAWQPSTGAASSTRAVGSQAWALSESVLNQVPSQYQAAIRGQWVDLDTDGTFTATLTLKDTTTVPAGGSYGVYTYGAGGVANAAQELSVPLNYAVQPKVTVSKTTGLDPEGETVTIRGTGFVPNAPGTSGTRPPLLGLFGGAYVVVGAFADDWKPSASAPSSARSQAAITKWGVHAADVATIGGDARGAIAIAADGTFEVTVDIVKSEAFTTGNWGVYTYAGGGAVHAPFETYTPIAFADPTPEPSITASVSDVSADAGASVRVVGTGFGSVSGAYAALIEKGTESQVSAGGGYAGFGYWMTPGAITGGAFDKTILAATANLDRTKQYEVIVWQGHSEPNASTIYARADVAFTDAQWNTLFPGTPTDPTDPTEPTTPTVKGSLSWGVSTSFVNYVTGPIANGSATASSGASKTAANLFTFPQAVQGTTYDATKSTGAVGYAGAVRFLGHGGALDVTIANPQVVVTSASAGELRVTTGGAQIILATLDLSTATRTIADGAVTFTGAPATLTAAGLDKVFGGSRPSGGLDAVTFTIGLPSVIVTPEVPTTPTTPTAPTTPTTPTTPTKPTTPSTGGTKTETVPGGSLRWAISSSFANYVTGDIAHGAISVSNGATRSGSQFQFGQASGSTFDAKTGLGSVSYVGSVRFTGHNGVLDVTVANPQVRVTSPTSATLYVSSGGSQVAFATLNLGAAAKTTSNGAVTFTAAPASITGAGVSQVFQGYALTGGLNPVTFTIGAAAAAPTGSTGTVATASASDDETRDIPSTPPATTGIELDDESLAALQSGGKATVTAAGFEPNESGIAVVVYSTPILLDTVTADAEGVATWSGSLPATLEDGEHTLTFQGSTARGIVFTLDRAASTAALGACVVDGASLNWGFKESFRTYIEGIAAGGWELTDVVYDYPDYVWSPGAGSLDVDSATGLVTYGGTIEFTGHDGALDTTLANARLELAGDTGYLVFDVSGTTQGGDAVEQTGVRFAEFALPELSVTDSAIVLDAVPSTLTEAGAAAFGTYAAGEALDPISAVIPVEAECGEAVAAPTDEDEAVAAPVTTTAAVDESGAPLWPWAIGGLVLVAAVAVVTGVVIGRRRKAAVAAATAGVATDA